MRRAAGRVGATIPWLVTLAVLACAETSPPSSTVTIVDSAGVRIVTNRPGSIEASETWSLTPEPVPDIGSGADPEVALFRVSDVVPLDRGRAAVAVNGPPRVLIFEQDGTLGTAFGQRGQGPGELSRIGSVVPLGPDSLALWDDTRRRLSVFTDAGAYVREVDLGGLAELTPIAAGAVTVPAAFTYLLPSTRDALVLFQVGAFGPGMGVRRVEAPSYRITTAGDSLATFGPFPGETTFMSDQSGLAPYLFGASTYGATSADRLVVGTAEAAELRVYDPAGALETIVRWPEPDRSVGGARLIAWTEWLEAELAPRTPEQRAMIREVLDRMPPAERFPAYADLVVADEGEIWVGDYPGQLGMLGLSSEVPRVPPRLWLVLGAGGVLVARVESPEGFQPHAVREGRVWGVFKDELGVESVRTYDIVRGEA